MEECSDDQCDPRLIADVLDVTQRHYRGAASAGATCGMSKRPLKIDQIVSPCRLRAHVRSYSPAHNSLLGRFALGIRLRNEGRFGAQAAGEGAGGMATNAQAAQAAQAGAIADPGVLRMVACPMPQRSWDIGRQLPAAPVSTGRDASNLVAIARRLAHPSHPAVQTPRLSGSQGANHIHMDMRNLGGRHCDCDRRGRVVTGVTGTCRVGSGRLGLRRNSRLCSFLL